MRSHPSLGTRALFALPPLVHGLLPFVPMPWLSLPGPTPHSLEIRYELTAPPTPTPPHPQTSTQAPSRTLSPRPLHRNDAL